MIIKKDRYAIFRRAILVTILLVLTQNSLYSENMNEKNACEKLFSTIEQKDTASAKILIDQTCIKECLNTKNETPLHLAVRNYKSKLIKKLLAGGANPNIENFDGETPLHYGVKSWISFNGINLLLSHGANINAKDKNGQTPLHAAAERGRPEIANLLLANGAIISKNNKGELPLHNAYDSKTALLLLAHGANVNEKSNRDLTPLHNAVVHHRYKDSGLIKTLLDNGANPNSKNYCGETPLHIAAFKNDVDTIRALILHGADINATSNEQNTPLHYALIWAFDEESIKILLDYGADLYAKNEDGKTPLMIAKKNRNKKIISLLQNEDIKRKTIFSD